MDGGPKGRNCSPPLVGTGPGRRTESAFNCDGGMSLQAGKRGFHSGRATHSAPPGVQPHPADGRHRQRQVFRHPADLAPGPAARRERHRLRPGDGFCGEFYSPAARRLDPQSARRSAAHIGGWAMRWTATETAATIAAAFLPDKEYEKAFFTDGPRRILAHLLRRKPQPRDILKWMADPAQIESMVKGTPLAALLDPAAPAQRAGVLSSLNMVADSWNCCRSGNETQGQTFCDGRVVHRAQALGVSDLQPRLPGEDFAASFRVAGPVHLAHDGILRRPRGEAGMVVHRRAGQPQQAAPTPHRRHRKPQVRQSGSAGFSGPQPDGKTLRPGRRGHAFPTCDKGFFKTSEPRAAKWISEAIGEIEVER